MESKLPVFVSYCQKDFDKVTIAEKEINKSKYFYALIIARNREPLKLLSVKVEEGILKSHATLPILTTKSIREQWINQEIAFAHAHKKLLLPIVEHSVINKLKGFIHKERDLPYMFNKTVDNSEFLIAVQKMLKDLEEGLNIKVPDLTLEQPKRKTMFDSTVERLRKHKEKTEKDQFLLSSKGQEIGTQEAVRLFKIIATKAAELKVQTNFNIEVEQDSAFEVSVRYQNLRIFAWVHHEGDLIKVSVQYETEQLRNLGIDEISKVTANKSKRVYSIDRVNEKYGWTYDERKNDFFTSEEISDYAFDWMGTELTSGRTA
ncbi:MAG TPA: hypothetical protein VK783_10935 [Bacteroidia bacterium]|jgi:hypothetical protein|nr:hypothetical protein [Bacteroidia bacterium]